MRRSLVLLASMIVAVAAVGCGAQTARPHTAAPDDTPRSTSTTGPVPADLVGTITSVTPFTPVEGCVPVEDVDPDAPISSDDPAVCAPTGADQPLGTALVEAAPRRDEGRKISFTVTGDTRIIVDGRLGDFDDLTVGWQVEAWVAGDVCDESYPEQCGAEALVLHP